MPTPIDSELAKQGAEWSTGMYAVLSGTLGRSPKVNELGDFAIGAIDVLFSASYGSIRNRFGEESARRWAEAVMTQITKSLKQVVKSDVVINIISKSK
jgi:hypothetical protein